MNLEDFEQVKRWTGFGAADVEHLRQLGAALEGHLPQIVARFYELLFQDPKARKFFQSQEVIERQHELFRSWMEGLFSGDYGTEYLEKRCRIGRAHVRVDLPQRFMFSGMNVVRNEITELVCDMGLSDSCRKIEAVNKLLDLDLAIMLESYREHYIAKIRAADRRAMQRQLAEVQHMATLGQLAASLAHEIKNPLAGISGAIQIMSQEIDAEHPHYEIMREILRQIDRLDTAVKDLLIYARPKPPELKRCDVGQTILTCLTLLNEDPMIKSLTIENSGLDQGIETLLDHAQFEQVISNLILNAAQACDGSGVVQIDLSQEADEVVVVVQDDGPGMPEEVFQQALEPFFTTKARGSGLGLPICKRIVEAHHGKLSISTAPGDGTRVRIVLPGMNSYQSSGGRHHESHQGAHHRG